MLKRLLRDESGAVATEYVVLTGLIAISLIAVIVAFRKDLIDLFNEFGTKVSDKHTETDATDSDTIPK